MSAERKISHASIRRSRQAQYGFSMRWYCYLLYFSIPVGVLLTLWNCYTVFYGVESWNAYYLMDAAYFALYVVLISTGWFFILNMKWAGVILFLTSVSVSVMYSFASSVLLWKLGLQNNSAESFGRAIVLTAYLGLNTWYFLKRRVMFDKRTQCAKALSPTKNSSLDLLAQLRDECEREQTQIDMRKVVRCRSWKIPFIISCCVCVAIISACIAGCVHYEKKLADIEETVHDLTIYKNNAIVVASRQNDSIKKKDSEIYELKSVITDINRRVGILVSANETVFHTTDCNFVEWDQNLGFFDIQFLLEEGYEYCKFCYTEFDKRMISAYEKFGW